MLDWGHVFENLLGKGIILSNKFEMLSNVYKSYFKNIVSKCCKNHVFKMGFQTPIFLLNVTSRYIIMTFGLFDQKALLCTI